MIRRRADRGDSNKRQQGANQMKDIICWPEGCNQIWKGPVGKIYYG